MKLNVYAVYDVKISAYMQPFFTPNNETAKRLISASQAANSLTAQFPQDFVLFLLGEWDDNLGRIDSVTPENLGNLSSIGEKYAPQ